MPNAFKLASRLQFTRNSVTVDNPPLTETTVATTSDIKTANVQIVGTTHAVIVRGDVTDLAAAMIENLHATAVVSVGGDNAGSFVKWFDIPAGERAFLPRVGTLATTYLKSTVASTPTQVTLIKVS